MRFNFQALTDYFNRRANGSWWFAWRPVYVELGNREGEWRWLEDVWRVQYVGGCIDEGYHYWRYYAHPGVRFPNGEFMV